MKNKTLTVDLKEVQIKELTKLYHESEFELKDLKEKHGSLLKQSNQLKENFAKIRKNYDREKDRLDMALRALDNATNKL